MIQDEITILKKAFPTFVVDVLEQIMKQQYEVFVVGGAVRDALLGRPIIDIDMTTNARPEQIEALFPSSIPTGKSFGTITIIIEANEKKHHIQITTYRADGTYSNSRHPDDIVYETNIHNDLKRRDFTVNAMAFNPISDVFIDDFNGINDLDAKQLCVVGDPEKRFTEDSLRLFRACRFAAQLDFDLADNTYRAMQNLANQFVLPSKERIHHELSALLQASYPHKGLVALKTTGLGKRLFSRFNDISDTAFKYIEKMDLSIRWPFLLQYLDLEEAFESLFFSKKEQRFITQLIHHNFDQAKASFTIKDLVVTGKDIQALGFSGKKIGEIQQYLFDRVIKDMSLNSKDVLMAMIDQAFL